MTFIDVLFAIVGFAGGFGVAWMVFGQRRPAMTGEADKELIRAHTQVSSLKEQLATVSTTLEQLRKDASDARERAVSMEAKKDALDTRIQEQREESEKRETQLKLHFENSGQKILEALGQKFGAQSEKQIGELLTPLRERITEFQKLVTDSFTTQGKEQHTLKAEIEKIVLQADGLTKALRGDVKAQGNWGEIMLERILEESGLQKGVAYTIQGTDMGLAGAEGNRLRPDVIVNLPDNKHIIIDSKVSLTAYERYSSENDDIARAGHLRDFIKSIRAHVNGLEGKRYQDMGKIQTPDFVLMFLPVEGAYSLAVQQDRELHSYAWGKKIVMVCPSTLFASLQTIASLWNMELRNQNAEKIAQAGGALYDKLMGFAEDMLDVGTHVNRMQKSYDLAMNKLKDGKGNLISRAENLKGMGIKTTKSLPSDLKANAMLEADEPELLEIEARAAS